MAVRFAAALLGLVSMLGSSSPLWAKGAMVRIEISGGTLTSPLQITDPQRLKEFTFFDGPGNNNVTLETAEKGSIIDWKTGIVRQHAADLQKVIGPDLQRYKVSFYWMGCAWDDPTSRDGKHPCAEVPTLAYVVFYEYDASSKQGFVYLPGKGEQWHDRNISTLYRPDAEGHWFFATDGWTSFVGPLIGQHRSH